MGMTDVGRRKMLDLLIGAGGNAVNGTNGHLGVGTSNTAFNANQTSLTGEVREIVDSAPSRSTDTITAIATFEAADANQVWAEVGLFNAAAADTMISRVVAALGTKASPAVWTLTYTLQVTNT